MTPRRRGTDQPALIPPVRYLLQGGFSPLRVLAEEQDARDR